MHIVYSGTSYYTIEKKIVEKFVVSTTTLSGVTIDAGTNYITATFSGIVKSAANGNLDATAFSLSSTGGTATVTGISSVTRGASSRIWVIVPTITGTIDGTESVQITLASRASVRDNFSRWVPLPDPVPTVTLAAPAASPTPSTTASATPTPSTTTAASSSVTPSISSSPSTTSSATPTPSTTSTPSATATSSPSTGASASATPTSSTTASASASPSTTASASPTSSTSPSPSPSTSVSASSSPSASASVTASPSASSSASPSTSTSPTPSNLPQGSAVQFPADNVVPIGGDTSDPVMKLRWRLEDAQGSEFVAGTSTEQPTHVRMSLELQQAAPADTEWVGLAQSSSGLMLGGGTGRAVVGLLGQNPPRVLPFDMVSTSGGKTAVLSSEASGNLFEAGDSAFAGSPPVGSQALEDGARAVVVVRRPLGDAEGAIAGSAIDGAWSAEEQASTGFIWAMGRMDAQGGSSGDAIGYHTSRGTGSVVLRPAVVCDNTVVCSGRGRCDVVQSASGGLQCVCDPGHAGSSCSECAAGFALDAASGRCRLPPQGADPGAKGPGAVSRVVLGLRLAVDFDQDYESDPDAFEMQFAADVSGALGIESSRVLVESVERGSVVVRFSIYPGANDTAASYNDLVVDLSAQVNNASSPLQSQGTLTSSVAAGSLNVLGFVLPEAPRTGFADMADSSFASQQELLDGLQMMWSLTDSEVPGGGSAVVSGSGSDPAGQYLHARLVHDRSSGWFALGFNPSDAAMPGAHSVVATLGAASSEEAVREYDLTARSGFGSGIRRDAESSVSNTRLYERNGSWVMEFTRALDTGDSGDHVLPAGGSEGELFMLVARHGSADSIESSGAHSLAGRSVVSVDLSTGAVEAVALAGLIVAHGVMMGLAWAVLVPTGILAARFCKRVGASPPNIERIKSAHVQSVRGRGGAVPAADIPTGPRVSLYHVAQANPGPASGLQKSHPADVPSGASAPSNDAKVADANKAARRAAPASVPCWFRTHQVAQGLAVVLTLIGFAVILAHVGSGEHFTSGHSVIGLVVVLMALCQGVLGAVRPHKGDDWREAWEWAHKGLGYAACVLGLVAVVLGAGLASDKAGIPRGGWVGVTAAAAAVWAVAYITLAVVYAVCIPTGSNGCDPKPVNGETVVQVPSHQQAVQVNAAGDGANPAEQA